MSIEYSCDSNKIPVYDASHKLIGFSDGIPTMIVHVSGKDDCTIVSDAIFKLMMKSSQWKSDSRTLEDR